MYSYVILSIIIILIILVTLNRNIKNKKKFRFTKENNKFNLSIFDKLSSIKNSMIKSRIKKEPILVKRPEYYFYSNNTIPTFTSKISIYPIENSNIRINKYNVKKTNYDLI